MSMRLLIVGQMGGQIGAASRIAMSRGAKVTQATGVDMAIDQLRAGKGADLVMIDIALDISRLIETLKSERISVPVVACGIEADAKAAAEAIRAGAEEYVPLPPDEDLIAAVLEAATAQSHALIYADPVMDKVVKMAEKVAPSNANILITGESGTGKEVFARHIHRKSKRSSGPFIALNCAAIPGELLESELFGHEKGSFTGAVARRIGKFEEAAGGTLLLDEISEMDLKLQAKLLRAIQEREINRIGSNASVKVDVRILATSNRKLEAEVKAGNFREDLFFRLNVMTLKLPALRERPGDIDILAQHFAKKFAAENDSPANMLADDALAALKTHSWRGNVRELENTLHRSVLLATGNQIDADAIVLTGEETASDSADGTTGGLVGRTVADVERDLILDTLKHTLGNRTHAATILGISIRTLRNKLRQYVDEGVAVPAPSA